MSNQNVENEMMKLCSKCGIVKMIMNFHFRTTKQRFRSECIQCFSIKQKNGEIKIMKNLKT